MPRKLIPRAAPEQLDMFGGMTHKAAVAQIKAAEKRPNGPYVDWDSDAGSLRIYYSEHPDDGEVALQGDFTKEDLLALIALWPTS
jgi:hypothetical protein